MPEEELTLEKRLENLEAQRAQQVDFLNQAKQSMMQGEMNLLRLEGAIELAKAIIEAQKPPESDASN